MLKLSPSAPSLGPQSLLGLCVQSGAERVVGMQSGSKSLYACLPDIPSAPSVLKTDSNINKQSPFSFSFAVLVMGPRASQNTLPLSCSPAPLCYFVSTMKSPAQGKSV